jgi:hypothetical protein
MTKLTGLRRIEAGVYEHPLGRYRVERIDSLGDGERKLEVTTSAWAVTERPVRPNGEWEEILSDYPTKAAAVAALYEQIREDNQKARNAP